MSQIKLLFGPLVMYAMYTYHPEDPFLLHCVFMMGEGFIVDDYVNPAV